MDAQVTAALISGGAALTVAVVGIGGAIVAQLFATRHAFENSLALQERQYAKQEHERHEQSRREDAYRFAEQRRSTYGRFVRLAREFLDAVEVEHSAAETLGRIESGTRVTLRVRLSVCLSGCVRAFTCRRARGVR